MSGPHILILGAPGAGKGTQSANLVEEFDIDHVTTGDALRANKDMETAFGTPRSFMEAGELVPDPVVNEIVEAALEEVDGYVLDGYPRNPEQAEFLDDITSLDIVLYLDVSREELVDRLTGRRVCSECGRNYHVDYSPPAEAGICDECGGDLIHREDDTDEIVRERIRVYEENTEPLIDHYASEGLLVRIDGEQPPEGVWTDVKSAVEAEIAG